MLTMTTNSYTCPGSADFSKVTGTRILPFIITLDTEHSILQPEAGQKQRFCYEITAVGEDTSRYADLSHFVLGICSNITQDEISAISVSINGTAQTIHYGPGGNVELRTAASPDPTTECPGLKFDFGLNKVNGVMNVCFELSNTYPIGDNALCLKGGTVVAKGLSICGPACSTGGCQVVGRQSLSACLPIKVTPTAHLGDVTVQCCGAVEVTKEECTAHTAESCTFYVIQSLCVGVPVTFSAQTEKGSIKVLCGGVVSGVCNCQGD